MTRSGRQRRSPVLVVLAALALLVSGAAVAVAGHQTPPARTFTYEVRQVGRVATPLEELAGHAAGAFNDVRGWSLGGSLRYERVASGGDFTLWLAEASTVPSFSSACSATYSCRVGRNVIINETRWRTGTASWTRSLHEYRSYVLMHELGHWHGRGHVGCPGRGQPAPVMQQQSIGLQGCVANVWPLAWERAAVAQRYGVAVRADAFTDIADSVHADAIRDLADRGTASGFADGSFRPEAAVLRGQLASTLARVRGLRPTGVSQFSDLTGSVHAESIRAMADASLLAGFPDGTFRPGDPVLRGQLASVLAASLGLDATDVSCAPADSAGSIHAGAICAVVRAGIARGSGPDRFDPQDVVQRGQLASFLR